MNKARITYRFDREAHPPVSAEASAVVPANHDSMMVENGRQAGKIIPLYQEDFGIGNRDYGVWKSPFDEETERIASIIRGGGEANPGSRIEKDTEEHKPLYYTAEDADLAFERIPFYEEQVSAAPMMYRRSRRRGNWFGMASAVAGAVLTGLVLGMFVLNLFRGEPESATTAAHDPLLPEINGDLSGLLPGADRTIQEADGGGIMPSDQVAALGAASVELPEQTYYLVQNGVFASSEGAELAAEQLKEKGLAGAVEIGDKRSVFAGAAMNRDDALLISQHLQSEGLEVYIKPYVLPAVQQIEWSGDNARIAQDYLMKSRGLIAALVEISMQHLSEVTPSPLLPDQLQSIKAEHQEWTTSANAALKEAPEPVKPLLQEMNAAANGAVIAVEQYNKKPSGAYMWQIQTAVTEHLIKQKEWLSASGV